MTDAIVVKSCACAYAILQRNVAKETHPNAGGRCVGNAHFSNAEYATTLIDARIHEVTACLYSFVELFHAHGWFVKKVFGATGYLAMDDAWNKRQVIVDADIHDA